MAPLDLKQLAQFFDPSTWARGRDYAVRKRILTIAGDIESTLSATVRGSGGKTYRQTIVAVRDRLGKLDSIAGRCSCPVAINCKHVAAVCYTVLDAMPEVAARADTVSRQAISEPRLPPALSGWLDRLQRQNDAGNDAKGWPATVRDRLLYIVDDSRPGNLSISVMKATLLKSGAFGATARRYDIDRIGRGDTPRFIAPEDVRIVNRMRVLGLGHYSTSYGMPSAPGELLLMVEMIARTGRGRFREVGGPVLTMGKERKGCFRWDRQGNGAQKLVLEDEAGRRLNALAVEPWAYIEPETGEIGPLLFNGPTHLIPALLNAPEIRPEHASDVALRLHQMGFESIPALQRIENEIRDGRSPVPHLTLSSTRASQPGSYGWGEQDVQLPTLRLSFDYQGRILEGGPGGEERFVEGEKAVVLRRDGNAEERAYRLLEEAGARFAADIAEKPARGARDTDLFFGDLESDPDFDLPEDQDTALRFMAQTVPRLKAEGWQITVGQDWPCPFFDGPADIVSSAEPQSGKAGMDWFSFGLRLEAGGQKLDLAPILLQLLEQIDFLDPDDAGLDDVVEAILDGLILYPQLEDGRFIALEASSLIPLLRVFLSATGLLSGFHPAQSGHLLEVADALEGCGIPFEAGADLLQLGRKLKSLADAPPAGPPAGFLAELRPYQQAGFGWLRALAETGFGGLLADDMGLGKTVQALALLADRYLGESPPADPALLVVPTSLVHAWKRQAAQFAPELKVLILHGKDRRQDFEAIAKHHLVITTYALLTRDVDILEKRRWEIVILDEAQAVKNPASAGAKSLRALDTGFRLALTGTPMENTLMDLWSLYDWLIPGLLGDRKSFRARFLQPIEQGGDTKVQAELKARLRPFLLRRTKQEVAVDLPEKTEITELVPLGAQQAGLYESVRLAMDERVRRTIAEKGLAASHITILDALLKLRQICCDPVLVRHEYAKAVRESAKRDRLIELLSDLIAEGRRVLVFSQFVGMLKLIEGDIKARGWPYAMLTGESRNRDEIVTGFQNGETPIFLISLKAGGTGLTLTGADTVILYDPWWNPAVERQAMDRVHRIGQDRKVFVYRLIAEGTVEQTISDLQERKQALADALFDGGENNPFTLDEGQIAALFRPLRD